MHCNFQESYILWLERMSVILFLYLLASQYILIKENMKIKILYLHPSKITAYMVVVN